MLLSRYEDFFKLRNAVVNNFNWVKLEFTVK